MDMDMDIDTENEKENGYVTVIIETGMWLTTIPIFFEGRGLWLRFLLESSYY